MQLSANIIEFIDAAMNLNIGTALHFPRGMDLLYNQGITRRSILYLLFRSDPREVLDSIFSTVDRVEFSRFELIRAGFRDLCC